MMSSKDECKCNSVERVDRTLPDGSPYHYYQCPRCNRIDYPPCEAQKLLEYSETHTFLFLDDWILLWLYVGDGAPVCGISKLQNDVFIVLMEFAQENGIPSENPGFRAYRSGPRTERIDRGMDTLTGMGLVWSVGRLNTDTERFFLTESGTEAAAKVSKRLTQEQLESLRKLRMDLQQFSARGEMEYVHSHYPEYTDETVVFERTLHRQRNRRFYPLGKAGVSTTLPENRPSERSWKEGRSDRIHPPRPKDSASVRDFPRSWAVPFYNPL